MHKDFSVTDSNDAAEQCLDFVRSDLESLKLTPKAVNRAVLMSEEALMRLCEHADFSEISRIRANVRNFLGNITIKLIVPGSEFSFSGGIEEIIPDDDALLDNEERLRNMFLRSFGENIIFKHSRRYNIVTVRAIRSEYSGLYMTLGALILAVAAGLVLRGSEAEAFLNSNILEPVKTIFMNGLKTCSVPIVFFSIVSCIADAGNLSDLRKSGMRLLRWFLLMQILAVIIGFGIVGLTGVGKGAGLTAVSQIAGSEAGNTLPSIADRIINIMPANIVRPFLEADMLQLILLAVLAGAAISSTGSKNVRNTFTELNRVFMKITGYLISLVPLVIFSSIASMIITTGMDTVMSLLGLLLAAVAGFAVMNVLYCLAVKFIAGLKPSVMCRKSLPALITGFTTCSSAAAIPDMMKSAEAMGVPSKLYSFGVPLGVSLNKTTLTMTLALFVTAAANMYGINIPHASFMSLGVSVLIMSFAAPAMPGVLIISLSILLTQAGCPVEFIGIAMGIDALLDMLATPTICAGNIVAMVIVSKLEGKFDMEQYYKP